MKITKIQDTITGPRFAGSRKTLSYDNKEAGQISSSDFQFPKLIIAYWSLVIIWLLVIGLWSLAAAMGGPAPKKEEPKYKLEILKMDVVGGPARTLEAAGQGPKYKLEILKMDVITAPVPSPEAKGANSP